MAKKPQADSRERIIEAAMALATELPWNEIELREIAERAGVSLAEFRDAFPSKGAILAGFSRMIDHKVLEGQTDDLIGEPAKDRLFDVLMRRLDALAPYKEALRHILPAVRRDPLTLVGLNQSALNSQRFMLMAAGIDTDDPLAPLKIQGLALAYARVVDVWLDDDEPGLSRTMAALDKALDRGARSLRYADDLYRLTAPFRAVAESLCSAPRHLRERARSRRERRSGGAEGMPRGGHPLDDGNEPVPV